MYILTIYVTWSIWTQVTGFDWDRGNAHKGADKHGVSQAEAESIFFNKPLLLLPDSKHSQQEPRYHALGTTNAGRLLHITFTLRASGSLIRVISARDMHRKEKTHYKQAQTDTTRIRHWNRGASLLGEPWFQWLYGLEAGHAGFIPESEALHQDHFIASPGDTTGTYKDRGQ